MYYKQTATISSQLHKKENREEIEITSDILRVNKKARPYRRQNYITIEDIGKEIPGFECFQRKLGPDNRNAKVLVGKQGDFAKFLGDIGDDD